MVLELTIENWIGIASITFGTAIAVISLLLSYFFNIKTLKQSETNLRLQLTYEDEKKL